MSKTKTYTTKTKEELQAEIEVMLESSLDKIKNYQESPEALIEFANFMVKIHQYSARNLALINKQFPGALAVASFVDWKARGFSVNKGEKGIKILTPTPFKIYENERGEWVTKMKANERDKEKIVKGELNERLVNAFKVGTVFDVSQTNATPADLPDIFPNRVWNFGVDDANSLSALSLGVTSIAKSLNIEITQDQELGVARGQYVQLTDGHEAIQLNHRNTATQNISTAIHELAHKHMHPFSRTEKSLGITSKEVKEFQAELTSFIVCKNYGMDTTDKTIPYIAKWTHNMRAIHLDILPKVLEGVRSTVHEFIETIDQSILLSDGQEKSNKDLIEVKEHSQDKDKNKTEKRLKRTKSTQKDLEMQL